jgi:hypothetical protein
MKMKFEILAACAAALLGAGVQAAEPPMGEAAYEAARKKIAAQYRVDRRTCDRLRGAAQDVCEKQAKGREKAESAWLEARYRPSPEAVKEAKLATAEAHYDIAMERCEARKGKAQSRCEDDAEAAREAAIRQARVEKVDAEREAQAKAREASRARKASATTRQG